MFANKKIGQVADHYAAIAGGLQKKPALVGHSFGGLLVQVLAGRGASAATVAVDPAPFRGVLPLPFSALKASSGVLKNPANRHRAVPLTLEQFRYGFANAVSEDEAKKLYEEYSVPGPVPRSSRPRRRTSTLTPMPKWRSRTPIAAPC